MDLSVKKSSLSEAEINWKSPNSLQGVPILGYKLEYELQTTEEVALLTEVQTNNTMFVLHKPGFIDCFTVDVTITPFNELGYGQNKSDTIYFGIGM